MADVRVAPAAWRSLDELIETRSLPASAQARVVATIQALRILPDRGRLLHGRWSGFRCILGPWPWMLIVYQFDPSSDVVAVVTIQDVRTAGAATGSP